LASPRCALDLSVVDGADGGRLVPQHAHAWSGMAPFREAVCAGEHLPGDGGERELVGAASSAPPKICSGDMYGTVPTWLLKAVRTGDPAQLGDAEVDDLGGGRSDQRTRRSRA